MAIIKPSLVIGAGGSGYWILSLLKRQLYINYGLNIDESDEVKFLLLDTLSEDKFETEYQEHVKSIGEQFAIKRKEYLHLGEPRGGFFSWAQQEHNYNDPLYHWFRRKLFIENFQVEANWKLTEGAAQLRQFGRMSFIFNKNRVKQAIINHLEVIKKVSGDATIPIWIFGSFAGGTGSGMLQDVAILTKLIAAQRGYAIRNIGGIVLPEVYKDTLLTSNAQGYSAFRELERFLSNTREKHRADIDNNSCSHVVALDREDVFYQNRFIFDNIIYFNEDCNSDQDRKNYFNKISDGITIFFDYSGAKDFFDEIINHKENRVTSISTYKIFIPINLYTRLFTATFLKDEIDRLFPNEKDSTIMMPKEDRQQEIQKDVNNFLNNLSPYILGLSQFIDEDKKALDYTHNNIIEEPGRILNDLFGYSMKEKYFGKEVGGTNYNLKLENLFVNIYDGKNISSADELKKLIKAKRANDKDYSLEKYIKEFKEEIDKDYLAYERIFKKENEDRVTIKTDLTAHYKDKLKNHIVEKLDGVSVSDIYYFLKRLTVIMEGTEEDSGGVKGILYRIVKNEFDSRRSVMDTDINKIAGEFSNINLVSESKMLGMFKSEKENYNAAVSLMKRYLSQRIKHLRFEQSENLALMLIEIHDEFSAYAGTRVLKSLVNKNNEISIDRYSIKNSLNNQVIDIRKVMRGGVGNASSIGITGDENEIEKYEDYLRKNIFAERPFSHLKVVFDKEAEQFLVEYSDSEHQKWYDNQRIDTGTDKKISLWTKIIDDIYKNIENTRLPQYEGIMHYLNWAREEMKNEKRFEAELEKKLLKADESIKLIDKTPKSYRLIYGDKKAGQYNLDANLKSLKEKMSNEVGEPVSDPTDSNKNIDFGDRNSLIFFAYSNEIMPESIEVLKNMKTEYTRQITSRGAVAWRSFVYHNYKCDWKMWEIERMLPEFKSKGLKTLTHGSFYWVLENDELVKLFVHCTALGIIREEKSLDNSKYWVCGPPSKTFEDNDEEVYLLTPENETSDMFTALVAFAVTQRQVDNIDKIDFDQVKRMLKDQLKVQKQKRKTFNQLKDGYADKNEWVKEYNKQVEVDKYEKQMWLFLSRIFWYYLKEEHKNENK